MNQKLTILCSDDLVETVSRTLNQKILEGYLHIPSAVGVKPGEHIGIDRTLSFPASVFLLTASSDLISSVLEELQGFANQCRVKPCLKMIVQEVLQVL
ncbi:MAG: hypothetical protein PHX83_01235 [Acidobacteriia bacterium]|nr:hypothetical protein [Terriglobia bacterium]